MLQSSTARWAGVVISGAVGYAAMIQLYKHVRGRCEAGTDENWVCPGVGAAGALTAGGVAAYILAGTRPPAEEVKLCPGLGDAPIGLPKFSIGN